MGGKDRQSGFLNFGCSGVINIQDCNNVLIKNQALFHPGHSLKLFQEVNKMEIGMSAELSHW